MNILKLIQAQAKATKKATERKIALANAIIANIDSAQGVARAVHTKAFLRWDKKQDAAAVQAFADAVTAKGQAYPLLTREGRVDVLRVAANATGRSPAALKIRLKALGALPTRKDLSAADLNKLVKKKA